MKKEFIERYNKLKALGDVTPDLKRQRGLDFEKLINDVFDDEGILLKRSYHTKDNKSEQVDSAVLVFNRIFLVEVKWVESGLAASELYAFIGKIENKFQGTLGVFISKEKLSDNFLNSVNKGRRQSVILIHGDDIDLLFSQEGLFNVYITHVIKRLSYDNLVHVPVEEFLKIQQSLPEMEATGIPIGNIKATIQKKAVKFIQDYLLQKKTPADQMLLLIEQQTPKEKELTFTFIVKRYANAWYNNLKDMSLSTIGNYDTYLSYSEPHKLENIIELTEVYYSELLPKSLEIYSREYFITTFSPYFARIDVKKKENFENFLVDSWSKWMGDWERENQLTDVIRPIWTQLSDPDTFEYLSYHYLDIFISSRSNKFSQKKFSAELLNKGLINKTTIENWLDIKLSEGKASIEALNEDNISFIASTYAVISKYLEIEIENWREYVKRKLEDIPLGE